VALLKLYFPTLAKAANGIIGIIAKARLLKKRRCSAPPLKMHRRGIKIPIVTSMIQEAADV
jgi:hypothetical protein